MSSFVHAFDLIFAALFLAKTRNAGIFLPHPRAAASTAAAVKVCHDAGVAAGAPKNFIQCVTEPSLETSKAVMSHPDIVSDAKGLIKQLLYWVCSHVVAL